MAGSSKDQYANLACISLAESAANTLTFAKLETGISLFEKVAWVISRLEIHYGSNLDTLMNGADDQLLVALCASNQLTTLTGASIPSNPAVLYGRRVKRLDFGAAAVALLWHDPEIIDFSTLPQGGIIVPPNPIYGAIQGVGLTAAADAYLRIYYTNVSLSPDQYWELVESRRIIAN